jgi:L-arabinose isomerase
MEVHVDPTVARVGSVQVVLRKLGRGSRAVTGRLVRAPRKGSVVVIEFSDGMHEYVTTPVKRVLRVAPRDIFYIETVNSRYRLEVRDRERTLDDASSG